MHGMTQVLVIVIFIVFILLTLQKNATANIRMRIFHFNLTRKCTDSRKTDQETLFCFFFFFVRLFSKELNRDPADSSRNNRQEEWFRLDQPIHKEVLYSEQTSDNKTLFTWHLNFHLISSFKAVFSKTVKEKKDGDFFFLALLNELQE